MTFISVILLATLTLLLISLRRTYGHIPPTELKKRARSGDQAAATLYKAAAYGPSLRLLLGALIVACSAWLFMLVADGLATWLAFIVMAFVLWFGFLRLPAGEMTRLAVVVANAAAPLIAKVMAYLHPLLDRVVQFVARHRPVSVHTGLYDVADLQHLFHQQKVQADNRIDAATLDLVEHVLTFGDKTVADVLVPRRVVTSVNSDETIGPILLDGLHKSGHSRFPVFDKEAGRVVGILFARDAVRAKTGGTIQKHMSTTVYFAHEDQPLQEVLSAMLKTHQQLFVVVNSFEEYTGIVTLEDIMEAILGKPIVDEFDEYESLRAVAQRQAAKEHQEHVFQDINDDNIQNLTEVV